MLFFKSRNEYPAPLKIRKVIERGWESEEELEARIKEMII